MLRIICNGKASFSAGRITNKLEKHRLNLADDRERERVRGTGNDTRAQKRVI